MRTAALWIVVFAGCAPAGLGNPGEVTPIDPPLVDVEPPDDGWADVLRECPPDVGTICPYAGAGFNGVHVDGDAVHRLDGWFSFPIDIAFPADGSRPVVFEPNNHKVRAVNADPDDGFETVVGALFAPDLPDPSRGVFRDDGVLVYVDDTAVRTWDPATGTEGVLVGVGTPHVVQGPADVAIDPLDHGVVYWIDSGTETIRRWDAATDVVEVFAGSGVQGAPGVSPGCASDPQPATETCFDFPNHGSTEGGGALAFSDDGAVLYVADSENHLIRAIEMATRTSATLSGSPGDFGFANGPAGQARWALPTDLAVDGDTLFVADTNNHRVRAIDLVTRTVTTLAGTGRTTCEIVDLLVPAQCDAIQDAGDGGLATEATLYRPFGVTVDPGGNVVLSDTYDHRLRVVYR